MPKTEVVSIRCTREEAAEMRRKAKAARKTLPEYIEHLISVHEQQGFTHCLTCTPNVTNSYEASSSA